MSKKNTSLTKSVVKTGLKYSAGIGTSMLMRHVGNNIIDSIPGGKVVKFCLKAGLFVGTVATNMVVMSTAEQLVDSVWDTTAAIGNAFKRASGETE